MTDEMHDARPLFKDWRRVYAVPNFALATNFSDAMAMKTTMKLDKTMDVGKTREELGGNRFMTLYIRLGKRYFSQCI